MLFSNSTSYCIYHGEALFHPFYFLCAFLRNYPEYWIPVLHIFIPVFYKPILARAKCICRCWAPFQGCPVLHTNQQPYRICKVWGLVWIVTSAEAEMSGDLYLYLWGSRDMGAGWTLSATPALSGGRIGGGTAGPRAKVNLCSSPAKLVFPNYKPKCDF